MGQLLRRPAVTGKLETDFLKPVPVGSTLHQRIRQRSYPLIERAGVLFAWLAAEGSTPPELPALDCFVPPPSHG